MLWQPIVSGFLKKGITNTLKSSFYRGAFHPQLYYLKVNFVERFFVLVHRNFGHLASQEGADPEKNINIEHRAGKALLAGGK
jgi:hypothetical protein